MEVSMARHEWLYQPESEKYNYLSRLNEPGSGFGSLYPREL
jgi:hypothetical protein